MQGAPLELRRGRLNWAGAGSKTGEKPWLWSTSKRGGTHSSNVTTGRATARSTSSCAMRRSWSRSLYTKQGPKTPELRFRALLADGAREVCFERVATSYTERDPYPQDHRSPHSAALVAVSVLLEATGDHYWRAVGRQPVTTALL